MPVQPRRDLASPAHPHDTGDVDPGVRSALARHAAAPTDPTSYVGALAALAGSRLIVPVVAVVGEIELDAAGLAHEKTSDMATVLLTGADGRTALLAFTGLESMVRWDPAARPVAVSASVAAQAAVQDGAAALVVDLAGPDRFVVEEEDLLGMARGWQVVGVGDRAAWIGPAPE